MPDQHDLLRRRVARSGERDRSDHEIEALLLPASRDRWDALWEAVDELEQETQHVRRGGGVQVDTTVVDGVERPVIQMPYAIYSDATQLVIRGLDEVGAIVPFDWPHWDGIDHYKGGDGLVSAPVADAVRMATAIIRADRFSEGTIAANLENGTLFAVLQRMRRWFQEKRESA
jgi:hypothetical protein